MLYYSILDNINQHMILHTSSGRKKSKLKFASAEAKRRYLESQQSWDNLKTKWGVTDTTSRKKNMVVNLSTVVGFVQRDTGPRPQSLNSWVTGATNMRTNNVYTGDKIIGIGTMHKSNAVPIFSDQEAQEIAKMRR